MTVAAETTPGHSVKAETSYVVLGQQSAREYLPGVEGDVDTTEMGKAINDVWIKVGEFTARSAEAAVKAHAEKAKPESGVFVAIPARSWQPMRVATKTETKLEVSAA